MILAPLWMFRLGSEEFDLCKLTVQSSFVEGQDALSCNRRMLPLEGASEIFGG